MILLLVKSYLFMLYPPSIIAKHFRYSWNKNVNKKNVDQKSLNQIFEDQELDLMVQHERFRTIALITVFVICTLTCFLACSLCESLKEGHRWLSVACNLPC